MKIQIKNNFIRTLDAINKRAELLLPKRRHAPGTAPCLVVDGMNIAYQAFYAYSKLSYMGNSTAILYGFVSILRPIIQQYNPSKVIVCWDGCKSPHRMQLLPEYKSHREKGRDPKARKKFLKQIEQTRELLFHLGICQAHNPQVEGDDMIYKVVKRQQCLTPVVIVSQDKDFKQLINFDVHQFFPKTKYVENVWGFTANNYGVEVPQYKDFLCLNGDKSDDIPGYPGMGEKRAAGLLAKVYSISQYLKDDTIEYPGLIDKKSVAKVYKRNNRMINLKLFDKLYNKKQKIPYYKGKSNPTFNIIGYSTICHNNGMKSINQPNFLKTFSNLH